MIRTALMLPPPPAQEGNVAAALCTLVRTAVTAPPDEWLRLRPGPLEPLQFARPRGGNMRASRGLYFWDARRPMGPWPWRLSCSAAWRWTQARGRPRAPLCKASGRSSRSLAAASESPPES